MNKHAELIYKRFAEKGRDHLYLEDLPELTPLEIINAANLMPDKVKVHRGDYGDTPLMLTKIG